MKEIFILALALLIDLALGEVPDRFHPVAWLGRLASLELRLAPPDGRVRQFVFGLLTAAGTAAILTWLVYSALQYVAGLNTIAYMIISAFILKSTFSLRGLWQAVGVVKGKLAKDDMPAARAGARALVSRDVESLDRRQLLSASIESCAENLCDSFVAPLFYYALGGLPGAVCYRIFNTFDAMIGYHGRWEYTGKFAARADDVLNFIPARLSALLIFPAAALCKANAAGGWRTMRAQHARTESPNAGWTMCAMAGALDVTLEKSGDYTLGPADNEISLNDVTQSQHIMLTAAAIWALIVMAVEAAFFYAAA